MKIWLPHSCIFNLDFTLCCGQVFRWDKKGEWWYGVVKENVLKVRQRGQELEFENIDAGFIRNYFGLNEDLEKIANRIAKDKIIKEALKEFKGLRIVQQDPWECLISYICATYKNISAIRRMLLNLSKKFGEKMTFDGNEFYTFPVPAKLAGAASADLKKCGLGYRVSYVCETAKKVHESYFDFERLRNLPYENARKELANFPGVGLKVADCVLLFSLGKLEAFPVDVWIKKAILKFYAKHFSPDFVEKMREKSLTSSQYAKLNMFGRSYFGEYAGYAQEYLYHYQRIHQ
jgi:N-glycosylase/DNA lyase